MELIRTGVDGLDEVLYGGVLRDNALLVEGTPGAGKTTLGLQYIYKGAVCFGQPGIIITFEEEPAKLYRDALSFGWDLKDLEKKNLLRVIPSSPEALKDMLLDQESGFTRLSKSIGACRIMVDSVTHFRRITDNVQQLRVLLSKFLTGLMSLTSSVFLIKEIESSAGEGADVEEYLVDTVLRLSYEQSRKHKRERSVEVIKSRGQKHISGRHTMRFTDTGIEVYPVCAGLHGLEDTSRTGSESPGASPVLREKTGIKVLDEMCRGGLPAGSATVVAGTSGTGKTVLVTQFLHEGLRKNKPALLLIFNDPPGALKSAGLSFSEDLARYRSDGLLRQIYRSSIDLSVDELLHRLRMLLDEHRPARVAVDGLTQLVQAIEDESYLVDYLGALLRLFSIYSVTSVFTFEVDKMFGSFEIESHRTLGLFDNLLLLRYVELDGDIRRALALLKMRGSDHDKSIQEYVITKFGIKVKTKFKGRVDVMGGTGRGPKVETVELKDVLDDATRWVEASRRMKERQRRSMK